MITMIGLLAYLILGLTHPAPIREHPMRGVFQPHFQDPDPQWKNLVDARK